MKIWDLFPFFNELPLLELRGLELAIPSIEFCSVELPRTFTDLPKPLNLTNAGPEFHFVKVHVPSVIPSGPHPTVDWFQRRQLGVFIQNADPEDIVMLSDVDEIPNRNVVKKVIEANYEHPVCLQMRLYYHRVDLWDPSGPWSGTIICKRKHLGESPDMQDLRNQRCYLPQIPNGGWHFSWLGRPEQIAEKLRAVDIERDSDNQMHHPGYDPAFLASCYETGVDLFGRREHDKVQVPILPGINQPHEIAGWLEKYPDYARQP